MVYELVLRQHLSLIEKRCREFVPNLQAIILHGGFGRDEGSWFQEESGVWLPYNDYDLCLIVDRKVSVRKVKDFEESLATEIGVNWIDLDQFTPNELKSLRSSIKSYDLKNASKVIAGDPKILNLIPTIESSKLSMKEAQILYFTRLYTLLGAVDEKGINQDLKGKASRFFRNQMAKAILAVVDVMLLAKGGYHASYRERVKRIAELYPQKTELQNLSRWALEEKLWPKAPEINAREVFEMYQAVHSQYLSAMYKALSLWFRKKITGPNDIEFCMKWLPINLVKRFYWLLRFADLRIENQVSVALSQGYLVAAWAPDHINEVHLRRAIELLRRVDNQLPAQLNWDQARREAIRLRMNS